MFLNRSNNFPEFPMNILVFIFMVKKRELNLKVSQLKSLLIQANFRPWSPAVKVLDGEAKSFEDDVHTLQTLNIPLKLKLPQ